jgi:chromosome segregation ATPase
MREAVAGERNKSEVLRIELLKMQIRVDVLTPLEEELRQARTKHDMQSSAYLKLEQNVAVLEAQKNSLEQQHSRLQAELTDAHLVRNKLADKVEATSLLLEREREARMHAERELAVTTATYVKRRSFGSRVYAKRRQP